MCVKISQWYLIYNNYIQFVSNSLWPFLYMRYLKRTFFNIFQNLYILLLYYYRKDIFLAKPLDFLNAMGCSLPNDW